MKSEIDGDALLSDLDSWENEYWGGADKAARKMISRRKRIARNTEYNRAHPEQYRAACKKYYQNNLEKESNRMKKYLKDNPEKYQAHLAVQRAKRNGAVVPKPCENCGSEKASAHHDDYTKPLEVRWLCHKCHMAWHSKLRKENA